MKTITKSSLGSSISQVVALVISYILDFKIDIKLSNFIGNFIGYLLNYFLQVKAFKSQEANNPKRFFYFSIEEFTTIFINQILFVYFLKLKNNINPTILRLIISSIVFFIISYPLRKLWVFKDNKTD